MTTFTEHVLASLEKTSTDIATNVKIERPPMKESIQALAYEIWQDAGEPEGKSLDCWLLAEKIIRHEEELAVYASFIDRHVVARHYKDIEAHFAITHNIYARNHADNR